MSYLRYLTFKTLRHFHPHSRIQLYTNSQFDIKSKGTGKGGIEEQEFADQKSIQVDYMPKLESLGVEIVKTGQFSKHAPNHQSDMFRWWYLISQGGFYLDTDQIILRSFKGLPLNYKFIYSSYDVKSDYAPNGHFSPVGVLGASTDSKIVKHIIRICPKYYNPSDYNCIGPWMFSDIESKIDMKEGFNAPYHYFYPAPICDKTKEIYNGALRLSKDNYSLHWFGGYGESQKFNKRYTEETARTSDDTISRFLREKKLI